MNWIEIKEKYPKSEPLIDKCIRTDRDLYDFFDEQGIHISVYYSDCEFFECSIFNNQGDIAGWDYLETNEFETRTEAEVKAFTKAFEILEEKL